MNFDLHKFESFPAEVMLEEEADNIDCEVENISIRDLITVRLTIQQIGEEYYCQGYITVPVEEECSRCLVLFDDEIAGDIIFSVKIGNTEGILSADEESIDVIYLKAGEHVVDFGHVVREAYILSLPTKPLCSPECKGLCLNCGVNLNEESCECKQKEFDERWEGLKGLTE